MAAYTFELSEMQRQKALALGEGGETWLANLSALVGELEQRWQVSAGRPLGGGTEALVLAAVRVGGMPVVLKVGRPAWPPQFKFVDLDGLFCERAYDLGISMREWSEELLAGDPLRLGQARCRLLHDLTGVDQDAIWQWGFIELVSTGLLLWQLGFRADAVQHFAIVEAWMAAPEG
jgi:hypothetical protein